MKKIVILMLVSLLVLSLTAVAFAGIANTLHNLTSSSGNATHTTDATVTLCGLCHIPHGGLGGISGLPIWARTINSAGSYTMYTSPTASGTNIAGVPGTFSLTCLSCHDGTIGIGTIHKNGITVTSAMTSTIAGLLSGNLFSSSYVNTVNGYTPFIGTNLSNDHPIAFQFPSAGYASTSPSGIGVTASGIAGSRVITGVSAVKYPLYLEGAQDYMFECSTCHDPHLQDTATQTMFLRSATLTICQDCHNNK